MLSFTLAFIALFGLSTYAREVTEDDQVECVFINRHVEGAKLYYVEDDHDAWMGSVAIADSLRLQSYPGHKFFLIDYLNDDFLGEFTVPECGEEGTKPSKSKRSKCEVEFVVHDREVTLAGFPEEELNCHDGYCEHEKLPIKRQPRWHKNARMQPLSFMPYGDEHVDRVMRARAMKARDAEVEKIKAKKK